MYINPHGALITCCSIRDVTVFLNETDHFLISFSQWRWQRWTKAHRHSTRSRGVFCQSSASCVSRRQSHFWHSTTSGDIRHLSSASWLTCYQWNEAMPLQMLAVHIKTCEGKLSSDETGDEVRANCFCFDVNCSLKWCFVHLQSSDEICFVENECKVNLA